MNTIKKILLGTAASLALTMAQASPINVGGVIWDPDNVQDFNSFSSAIHQFVADDGSLSGYGLINQINGLGPASFCPGCEMTFKFDGFTPVAEGAVPTTPGQVIGYSGGAVHVYVNHGPSTITPFDPTSLTADNTGLGDLWLSLAAHELFGTTFTGTVLGFGSNITALSGIGLVDVVGGLAAAQFDTNTQTDGADLAYANSFTQLLPRNNPRDALGNGNFTGDTFAANTVPEPASLALIALGLLGAGLASRRKRRD